MLHIEAAGARIEPDKSSRRYLTLTPAALARLALGHTGIDRALGRGRGGGLDGYRRRRRPRPVPDPPDLAEPAGRGHRVKSAVPRLRHRRRPTAASR